MAKDHSDLRISAFECDILRSAFRKSVAEDRIAETKWREHAMHLVREFTDYEHIDAALLDWIVRK